MAACLLGCSENIKNHIFYKPDSNYGALTFQIFSWVLRHLKNLDKSENLSCSKLPDVGFQNDRI